MSGFLTLFQPSDSDVISEDISDAETESDIETEDVGERGYFVQLKEKPVSEINSKTYLMGENEAEAINSIKYDRVIQ